MRAIRLTFNRAIKVEPSEIATYDSSLGWETNWSPHVNVRYSIPRDTNMKQVFTVE